MENDEESMHMKRREEKRRKTEIRAGTRKGKGKGNEGELLISVRACVRACVQDSRAFNSIMIRDEPRDCCCSRNERCRGWGMEKNSF